MTVYKKQIGGSHYLKFKIQPSEFANKNKPNLRPLPPGFTLTKSKDPDMTPMTEEEEYRNAGITKEEAEKK